MRSWTLVFLMACFLGAVAGAVGCGNAGTPSASTPDVPPNTEPSRRSVQRQAVRAGVWRLVYCLEDGEDAADLLALLHEITEQQPFGKRIEVHNCNDLSSDTLGTGPISLFGNRIPAGAERLPLHKSPTGWTLANAPDLAAGDVLFLPNARNPWAVNTTVAGFFMANDIAALIRRVRKTYEGNYEQMFWPSWAYELYRPNGDIVYGSYADTSWRFDPAQEIKMTNPEKPVYDEDGLRMFAYDGPVNDGQINQVQTVLQQVKSYCASLPATTAAGYPEVRLYPSLERIGLRTGKMKPVQYDPAKALLHLVPSMLTDASLLLTLETWLPFTAWYAQNPVAGADYREMVCLLQSRFLKQGGGETEQLLAQRIAQAKRLAGTGVLTITRQDTPSDFVLEYRARLASEFIGELSLPQLLLVVNTYAKGKSYRVSDDFLRPKATTRIVAPEHQALPTDKLGGMTFAHEGYRVHNGYGGEKIVSSLDSLAKLNVNALAIVPYTFMRDPEKPAEFFLPDQAGQENDWATIRSAREAQGRGWFVLLKPQIWVGGGHWPGDVDFATEAEWDAFFDNYTYWIMHYALLAEREQIGGLCLGTELVKTTLKHPDRWREIIRKVRQVYGGQLTYAANWGEEFEGFTFWDDLDAIGLNSYYPLSKMETPTDEVLLAGAREWLTMAAGVSRESDRPLWLTEVGFRSVDRSWTDPHAEAGGRNANPTDQARCYTALLTAAAATPELAGMFVWKWPSYLGDKNYREPGTQFTPGGKPAADLLGGFYGGWQRK